MRKAKYKSADVAELKKYYSYDYREGSLILNKTNRIMNLSIDESGRLKIKVNNNNITEVKAIVPPGALLI